MAADTTSNSFHQTREIPVQGYSPVSCAALFASFARRQEVTNSVLLSVGHGPISEHEFQRIMKESGLTLFSHGLFGDEELLSLLKRALRRHDLAHVIGRDGWEPGQLVGVFKANQGKTLKFYSQEMFLTLLLTGIDPFELGRETVERFALGHSALEFVSEMWPEWYSADASDAQTLNGSRIDRLETGLLKAAGYSVGESGKPYVARRRALKFVYDADLPNVSFSHRFSEQYLRSWGPPASSSRLRKIANSIAMFCSEAKRKLPQNRPLKAIAHWDSDLLWLKNELYDSDMPFAWPNSAIE
ncbi:MAG: hypothetical protein NXI04_24450 [Planctomycetaceae bacterium]|nr:hypothetical protein [Planctomycetaceae bacterium]